MDQGCQSTLTRTRAAGPRYAGFATSWRPSRHFAYRVSSTSTLLPARSVASTPALWRELADKLAEQIGRGEYEPGQRLPQIKNYQVDAGEGSKATVHAAYKALEAEGLVTSTRGHGTVVREQVPLKRLGHLIKAPAAPTARRAPRRPGLRSCLRPRSSPAAVRTPDSLG
ncbi:hypothetical protein STANM309S_05076 [Streptomyces tanashiensis]